ncbi:MAG: serine hydroxymethyltransferase [Planctomycetales bacterium]|nr:serine hydroxymethyltransferase [Planctomycetales bacterium]
MSSIAAQDPQLYAALEAEYRRQQDGLEMIASENYTSQAVMEAVGSVLTNKYAEGYPGRRYYGGCEHVDTVERLAIDRACQLFGAEAANVQPHSGSQANTAVYMACLNPGDTVLGLDLAQGGHLTHGMHLNISGKLYRFVPYGVDPQHHRIDFDQVARLAREHKPKLIVAGASAYPREIQHARFAQIAQDCGAKLMVDMAHYAGLVAAGVHDNPVPVADYVTTTTHKTLRGPRSGLVLCKQEHLKSVNSAVFPGLQGGPLMHAVAGKAVCFGEALQDSFRQYGKLIVENAKTLAEALLADGMRLISGGTDNHLMLVDVTSIGLSGKQAERTLDECGITVNMNMIPYDTRKPMDPSGIRIGTPALTTRGMANSEMKQIANWISLALRNIDDQTLHTKIRTEIREFCKSFPVPATR